MLSLAREERVNFTLTIGAAKECIVKHTQKHTQKTNHSLMRNVLLIQCCSCTVNWRAHGNKDSSVPLKRFSLSL